MTLIFPHFLDWFESGGPDQVEMPLTIEASVVYAVGDVLQILQQPIAIVGGLTAVLLAIGIWLIYSAGPKASKLSATTVIKKGWEAFKKSKQPLLISVAVLWVVSFALGQIIQTIPANFGFIQIASIVADIIESYIHFGIFALGLLALSHKKFTIKNLITEPVKFAKFFIATILYSLIVGFGFILFIIPGIYFWVKYMLYPYYILDKNMGIFEALNASGQATVNNKMDILWISVVMQLLSLLMIPTLGLASFILIPLHAIVIAIIYKQTS